MTIGHQEVTTSLCIYVPSFWHCLFLPAVSSNDINNLSSVTYERLFVAGVVIQCRVNVQRKARDIKRRVIIVATQAKCLLHTHTASHGMYYSLLK